VPDSPPREWTDAEIRALEEPEQWDWDSTEASEPSPAERRGADLTLGLSRDEFRLVAQAAKLRGVKLTDFVRQAAVERAAVVVGETGRSAEARS
jgi:hypothetical protein